jgi:hypothetical protein
MAWKTKQAFVAKRATLPARAMPLAAMAAKTDPSQQLQDRQAQCLPPRRRPFSMESAALAQPPFVRRAARHSAGT